MALCLPVGSLLFKPPQSPQPDYSTLCWVLASGQLKSPSLKILTRASHSQITLVLRVTCRHFKRVIMSRFDSRLPLPSACGFGCALPFRPSPAARPSGHSPYCLDSQHIGQPSLSPHISLTLTAEEALTSPCSSLLLSKKQTTNKNQFT